MRSKDPIAGDASAHEDRALVELVGELRACGYRFSTVTPLSQARVNARRCNEFARDLAGVFGWSRPFAKDLLPQRMVDLMRAANVLAGDVAGFRSRIRISTLGEQMYVHSAFPTTDANSVFFGPDTVRFLHAIDRHLASRPAPPRRVADVGCGAGPGAIAVAGAVPDVDVHALDINPLALRYTRVNAAANGVVVHASESDLLLQTEGSFDLIVSNPPYLVDGDRRAYRHGGGRFGEGLSLRILQEAMPRLANGGTLLLYTGTAVADGQDVFFAACRDRLESARLRWTYQEVDPDVFGEELDTPAYADADRIAATVLTVTNESLT